MKLKIQKVVNAKLPKYAHKGDAGLDLYSAEDVRLKPFEIKSVSTGIKVAIPKGYAGLVWDKSGRALQGLHAMAGVIDSGYRGVVCCVLINVSQKGIEIKKDTKIAQLLIQPIQKVTVEEVSRLDTTHRGSHGFGSSGIR